MTPLSSLQLKRPRFWKKRSQRQVSQPTPGQASASACIRELLSVFSWRCSCAIACGKCWSGNCSRQKSPLSHHLAATYTKIFKCVKFLAFSHMSCVIMQSCKHCQKQATVHFLQQRHPEKRISAASSGQTEPVSGAIHSLHIQNINETSPGIVLQHICYLLCAKLSQKISNNTVFFKKTSRWQRLNRTSS